MRRLEMENGADFLFKDLYRLIRDRSRRLLLRQRTGKCAADHQKNGRWARLELCEVLKRCRLRLLLRASCTRDTTTRHVGRETVVLQFLCERTEVATGHVDEKGCVLRGSLGEDGRRLVFIGSMVSAGEDQFRGVTTIRERDAERRGSGSRSRIVTTDSGGGA